jgi:hypothetical protein
MTFFFPTYCSICVVFHETGKKGQPLRSLSPDHMSLFMSFTHLSLNFLP